MSITRSKKWLMSIIWLLLAASLATVSVHASATVTVLDDKLSVTDSMGTGTVADNTVTITAAGDNAQYLTNSIIIKNETALTAEVSFSYKITGYHTGLTVAGTLVADSGEYFGTYTQNLSAGEEISISLKSEMRSARIGTLTLSDFGFVEASTDMNITVSFNSSGSVTANGTATTNGSVHTVLQNGTLALNATAKSGATFLGWIDASTNKVLSATATFSLSPTSDMDIYAVFAAKGIAAWFTVPSGADSYLYDDLNNATTKAATTTDKKVILANDGTLFSGTYTIPSGVTLLIPRDAANTVYEATPTCETTYVKPTIYRTLVMNSGAKITVNGKLSVAGIQCSTMPYNGYVKGPTAYIQMNENSNITIENGANLYAWGYIIGSGMVEAKSGATVYENFQLADFRGGDGTQKMTSVSWLGKDNPTDYHVFPLTQYYMQNIEVPLKLHAGAIENGYTSFNVTLVGTNGSNIPVISSSTGSGVFKLQSGYIIKDYIEDKGRIEYSIYGDVTLSSSTISMKLSGLGSVDIDSSKYNFPIPSHMTIDIVSGNVTIEQHVAFYPGSELYVREGATATVASGCRVIAYDLDDWGGYCGASNKTYVALTFVPGGNGTTGREKDALIQIDGTIEVLGAFYTTFGGANVFSTDKGQIKINKGTDTTTYQAEQTTKQGLLGSSQEIAYPSIAITSAKLKNADGSFVSTETATYYYHPRCGKWAKGVVIPADVVTAPTCTTDGCTIYNCTTCGTNLTFDEVAALGHKAGDWTGPVDGYELCSCTVCTEEIARRLYSTLALDYRLNDYIWMNAVVTIPADGDVKLVDNYGGTIHLVEGNGGTYYLVRKVLSTDLTTEFKVKLSIGEIETVELDLSFTTFASSLSEKHPHKELVNAMINYGKAADDYFPGGSSSKFFAETFTFADVCTAEKDRLPEEGYTGQFAARNEYNGIKLKTVGATIDFSNCLGMTLRFKATGDIEIPNGSKDQIVQIGFMIGMRDEYLKGTKELCVESYEQAFIYYGTNNGSVDGSGNQLQGVVGSQSGMVTQLPDDLSQEMRLRFDMTCDQYLTRFAMRPFIVIQHTEGDVVTYTNLYGEQVLYGFEDYCYRTANKNTSQESVNLVVYAWKYALEAARAEFN